MIEKQGKTRGAFITLEGPEGCGKSTQAKLLGDYLKKRGYDVIFIREPGGTKISEAIRNILLDPRNKVMSIGCEMLLYMSARAQAVSEVIRPALQEGKIVLCDRFLDSTRAYQGFGLRIKMDLINRIGAFATQGIKPDLTILLDVPLKKGLAYRQAHKDRIEQRPLAYHLRVRRGYFKLARTQPQRIKIVKVDKDFAVTQDKIRNLVLPILA